MDSQRAGLAIIAFLAGVVVTILGGKMTAQVASPWWFFSPPSPPPQIVDADALGISVENYNTMVTALRNIYGTYTSPEVQEGMAVADVEEDYASAGTVCTGRSVGSCSVGGIYADCGQNVLCVDRSDLTGCKCNE